LELAIEASTVAFGEPRWLAPFLAALWSCGPLLRPATGPSAFWSRAGHRNDHVPGPGLWVRVKRVLMPDGRELPLHEEPVYFLRWELVRTARLYETLPADIRRIATLSWVRSCWTLFRSATVRTRRHLRARDLPVADGRTVSPFGRPGLPRVLPFLVGGGVRFRSSPSLAG
jgi:hypothetical protein